MDGSPANYRAEKGSKFLHPVTRTFAPLWPFGRSQPQVCIFIDLCLPPAAFTAFRWSLKNLVSSARIPQPRFLSQDSSAKIPQPGFSAKISLLRFLSQDLPPELLPLIENKLCLGLHAGVMFQNKTPFKSSSAAGARRGQGTPMHKGCTCVGAKSKPF